MRVWRPHERISALIRKDRKKLASLSALYHVGEKRDGCLKPRRELSPRTWSAGLLILDFTARTRRNEFVV